MPIKKNNLEVWGMFCLAMVLFVASVLIPFLTCTWPGMEATKCRFHYSEPLAFPN